MPFWTSTATAMVTTGDVEVGGGLAVAGALSSGSVSTANGVFSSGVTVGGNLAVTGAVTGASFTGAHAGSGASLTSIPETAITDGSIFPRVAANETITGAWTFGTSLGIIAPAGNNLTIRHRGGPDTNVSVQDWTNNAATVVHSTLTVGSSSNVIWDAASFTFTGGGITAPSFTGSGAALTGIPETAITDGSLLARVGGSETITGAWVFNGSNPQSIAEASAGVAFTFRGRASDNASGVFWNNNAGGTVYGSIQAASTGGGSLQYSVSGGAHSFVGGQITIPNGSASTPALAFASDPDTGIFRDQGNTLSVAAGATRVLNAERVGGGSIRVSVPSADYGAGPADGPSLLIGRNSNGSPAPGTLGLTDRNGVTWYLWVDSSGDLRIGSPPPQNGGSDVIGVVVGTQA